MGEILYETIPDPTEIEIDEEGKEVEVSNGEQSPITLSLKILVLILKKKISFIRSVQKYGRM